VVAGWADLDGWGWHVISVHENTAIQQSPRLLLLYSLV
jgi:hypothetical protein